MADINLIIKIPEELAEKGHWYTDEEIWAVVRSVQNGTPISDNATNGDMPCITHEEMQECKDIVEKYTPKQESCEDAVSREAVMRLIENKPYDWSNLTERHNMLMEIRKLLPVTLRPKSGKWIIKEDNTSFVKTIPRRWTECSCCKWSMSPGYVDRYAFCPNCGAKMVEPQERSDKE